MKLDEKINLYEILSRDKRINRFKRFHIIEVKTILLFLMQIGNSKSRMIDRVKRMIYLNEIICRKKTYISYMRLLDKFNNIEIKSDIEEYIKIRKDLMEYIESIDLTENKQIIISFKTLILYEECIQKLYEKGAINKEKILELLRKTT